MFKKCLPLLALLLISSVRADVVPSAIFSDHAVLQRDLAIPIWGTADAGERVSIKIAGKEASAVTGADGKWIVRIDALPAGGPFEMVISGKNSVTLHDVLVGEVWLCSGQSNMEFTLSKSAKYFAGVVDEEKELAEANYPQIRQCVVEMKLTDSPQSSAKMNWSICNPENAKAFSAVAYYFGRSLHKELKVPIGLINSSYGASTAQAWISKPAMSSRPELLEILKAYDEATAKFDTPENLAKFEKALADWKIADEKAKAENKRGPRKPGNPHQDQHNPCLLFNAMINPVIPYAIKGAIWYQGESNGYNVKQYFSIMETLIADWRSRFGQGDFPFLVVQLASYKAPATQPVQGNSQIAQVRDVQQKLTALSNVGLAVITDHGDEKDVHPHVKYPVGDRLALSALSIAYGKQIESTGPVFESMKIENGSLRLNFTHAQGLVSKQDKLEGFAIAGDDGKFQYADAVIDGNTIVLKSEKVPNPTKARYNWSDNPPGRLFNSAGLPASPFKTD